MRAVGAAVVLVLALLCPPVAGAIAPPIYGPPLGGYAARAPVGVVVTIHGGGWVSEGAIYQAAQPTVLYRRAGWATYNVDLRPGYLGIEDVVAAYDVVRHAVGPSVPICAAGQSSGGH